MSAKQEKPWFVYILLCNDNSFYTGIALDVQQRYAIHKSGKGARYTRVKGVKKVLYTEKLSNHSKALQRELEIKKLPRFKKQLLIK